MQTIDIAATDIVEAPLNPNKMDDDVFARLVKAIERLGFWQPILVRSVPGPGGAQRYQIADGHHRYKAGLQLGMKHLPCVLVDKLSEDEIRALSLGMNRLRGEIDLSEAALELANIQNGGWTPEEMEATGFSSAEITDLLASINQTDREEVAPTDTAEAEKDDKAKATYTLEIEFETKADYVAARKAIKKAAGKGAPLFKGLLNIIDDNANAEAAA